MAKIRTFADKLKKDKNARLCPVCGTAMQPVRAVRPEIHATKGSWRFRDRIVIVCKCNHKEIYG
jgi:RNase P subunit RPR2